jgi:hypothetical protein
MESVDTEASKILLIWLLVTMVVCPGRRIPLSLIDPVRHRHMPSVSDFWYNINMRKSGTHQRKNCAPRMLMESAGRRIGTLCTKAASCLMKKRKMYACVERIGKMQESRNR